MAEQFSRRRMPVRLTLSPGKRGTKRLWREHGDRLVCVRYRYDALAGKRYKTVELIVEESEWIAGAKRIPESRWVKDKIAYHERGLREAVKLAGGYWDRDERIWWLRFGEVVRLGIKGRVTD